MADKCYRKVSVSLPVDLLEVGQECAQDNHYSFSGFIAEALERDLRSRGAIPASEDERLLFSALREALRIRGAKPVLRVLTELVEKEVANG